MLNIEVYKSTNFFNGLNKLATQYDQLRRQQTTINLGDTCMHLHLGGQGKTTLTVALTN
jgi:hypothetical protein